MSITGFVSDIYRVNHLKQLANTVDNAYRVNHLKESAEAIDNKQSADTKRILELRKKGVSYRVIAIAVDLSHETVRKVCKQYLE